MISRGLQRSKGLRGKVTQWRKSSKWVEPDEAYFWATHQGAELDLLLFKGGRRFGVEIKRMDAPTLTPSMRIALADLQLAHLTVVYPGKQSYELGPEVTVSSLGSRADLIEFSLLLQEVFGGRFGSILALNACAHGVRFAEVYPA